MTAYTFLYLGGLPGYLLERKKKGSQRWMKLNFEVFTAGKPHFPRLLPGNLGNFPGCL